MFRFLKNGAAAGLVAAALVLPALPAEVAGLVPADLAGAAAAGGDVSAAMAVCRKAFATRAKTSKNCFIRGF